MKHHMTRHAEGPSMVEVLMRHCGKGAKRDAGGSVPPAGYYSAGGSPAARLASGKCVGATSGERPAARLATGKNVTGAAEGGPRRRAMGGVGKLRHS